MKFLLTALGLNCANAKYACLYCKIERANRSDMSKSELYYYEDKTVRSPEEISKLCKRSHSNYGCINPPLLNIDLDHVVIDELHLMMRICDVLLRNLIEDSVAQDKKEILENRVGKSQVSP